MAREKDDVTEDDLWDLIEPISEELGDDGLIEELVRVVQKDKLARYLKKIAFDNEIDLEEEEGPGESDDEDDDESETDEEDEDDVRSALGR